MATWTILSFVNAGGKSVVEEWYSGLPPRSRAKWTWIIGFLKDHELLDWREHYKPLTNGEGIGEIRFHSDNIQHRPLGFFGPQPGQFSIVVCAKERGGHFEPKSALQVAKNNMGIAKKDPKTRLCELGKRKKESA